MNMMQKCEKLESAFVSDRELAATCLQKQVKSALSVIFNDFATIP